MKRLFIAVKVVPNYNTLEVYNYLRRVLNYNNINWVDPDRFHLTFKFLGKTSESEILHIIEVIKVTVEMYNKINIELNKVGIFGSSYKPRVIWLGIAQNTQLENLAMSLLDNLTSIGFLKDRQNFIPHITIGRINKIIDKQLFNNSIDIVKDKFLQQSVVDKIVLYDSVLSTKGPKYNELFSMPLL